MVPGIVIEVGENIDVLIEAIEVVRQVMAGELVAPRALRAFDGALELRSFGR